jgi:hypothetical protein
LTIPQIFAQVVGDSSETTFDEAAGEINVAGEVTDEVDGNLRAWINE